MPDVNLSKKNGARLRLKKALLLNECFALNYRPQSLALFISEYLCSKLDDDCDIEAFAQALQFGDYRKASFDYIHQDHDETMLSKPAILECEGLPDLFVRETLAQETIKIFIKNPRARGQILRFMENCPDGFSQFFKEKYDLPGIHSLVRQGLVKSAVMPDGIDVVLKKENPAKQDRFLKEQQAITRLFDLGLSESAVRVQSKGKKLNISLLEYLATVVDKDGSCFSISRKRNSPTLEEILLQTHDIESRQKILGDVSALLEWLYSKGVVWGDFAPRNILYQETASGIEYTILDFEKTDFTEAAVPYDRRIQHARGSMCVEEFGAVCTREELDFCFGEYFIPAMWDVDSKAPLKMASPKRDYLEILSRRGVNKPTQGEYDALEQEIMEIRFPYFDHQLGQMMYPLHIGFRVDHYFGFVADLETTEILVCSKKMGVFEQCARLLNGWLERLDEDLYKDEFISIVERKKPMESPVMLEAGQKIMGLIGQLYKTRNTPSFVDILNKEGPSNRLGNRRDACEPR